MATAEAARRGSESLASTKAPWDRQGIVVGPGAVEGRAADRRRTTTHAAHPTAVRATTAARGPARRLTDTEESAAIEDL